MRKKSSLNASGFAAVEAVLVVVIIAAVIGIGAYVLQQKKQANKTLSSTNTAQTSTQTTPANGSTSSIDQLTLQDAHTEAATEGSADTQNQQTSTAPDSALSNVGGAYNENNL